MPRLPNVNDLAAQIQARVSQSTAASMAKTAAENPPREFSIPAAQTLSKLARNLRDASADDITYDDMQEFATMLGH